MYAISYVLKSGGGFRCNMDFFDEEVKINDAKKFIKHYNKNVIGICEKEKVYVVDNIDIEAIKKDKKVIVDVQEEARKQGFNIDDNTVREVVIQPRREIKQVQNKKE